MGSVSQSLHAVWAVLTIAVYAGAYWVTKDLIAGITDNHKATLAPLDDYIKYAGLVGCIVVGIIADKLSARAAVNVTSIATALIYLVAFVAADGKILKGMEKELAIALRGLTVLQHTMQAAMTYALIRSGPTAASYGVAAGLQVSAGYTAGMLLAQKYALQLVGGNTQVLLLACAGATAATIVLSYFVPSSVPHLIARRADGSLRAVVAPGVKKSFFAVAFVALPILGFVAATRVGRVFVQQARTHLQVGDAPIWSSWPMGVDAAAGLLNNVFIVPALLVFTRGPGTIMLVYIGAALALRLAMVSDPALVADRTQAQFFYFAFSVIAAALYSVPTMLVGITAEAGTKGRLLAIQNVASGLIYTHADAVKAFFIGQAKVLAPALTPLSLSANELEALVVFGVLSIALVMLPAVSMMHPSNEPGMLRDASSAKAPANTSAAADAKAKQAGAEAAKVKDGAKKSTGKK